MIALLAGSRLGLHTLQLTKGSARLLPEIFPTVDHIARFNLSTENAQAILTDADVHLGAVAVPYALALHEDYIVASIDWTRSLGLLKKRSRNQRVNASSMHEILYLSASAGLPSPALEHFHLLREMRNAQIHAGGRSTPRLMSAIATAEMADSDSWRRLTGREPSAVVVRGRVAFQVGDLVAAFATTKELGRRVNELLAGLIPRDTWAEVAAEDYQAVAGAAKLRNSPNWLRSLVGYARVFYRPLGLTQSELKGGAKRVGLWDR